MTTDDKLELILQKLQVFDDKMQTMDDRMQSIDDRMQSMDDRMQTMDDRMQTMDDRIQSIEKQGQDTFRELMIVEKQVLTNQDSIKELNIKYDTLLLKADNSELLLKLINRQSEEMAALKFRVDQLEKKLA